MRKFLSFVFIIILVFTGCNTNNDIAKNESSKSGSTSIESENPLLSNNIEAENEEKVKAQN